MSRSTTAYHHGNLGPALEDAALELMRTQGHATLSLREVARMAGVSHNAPYHHFGDRTALLKRLSERSMEELLVAMQDARAGVESSGEPAETAVRVGLAYVTYAAQHPERFRVVYDPEVCVPGSPSVAMAPLLAGVEGILADMTATLFPDAAADRIGPLVISVWASVHGLAELVVAGHVAEGDAEPTLRALFTRN